MARFSEVVNDIQNQYFVIEKIRCIKGIEEMVKIGKNVIKVARPQVRAKTSTPFFLTDLTNATGVCLSTISTGSEGASIGRFFCLGKNASQSRRR
jgi:hypothetical protein